MAPRWFVDESALGLGKLLARVRDDVLYAGHPDLPEIPLGTADVTWMPLVAVLDWVAIRRDRRIHTRPSEVRVFAEVGLRTVWLGGKKDTASPSNSSSSLGTGRRWSADERSSARDRGASRFSEVGCRHVSGGPSSDVGPFST